MSTLVSHCLNSFCALRILYLLVFAWVHPFSSAFAAKLHVVFAIDEVAVGVGNRDAAQLFSDCLMLNIPSSNLEFYRIQENRMSEVEMLDVIRRVPVAADDALMFVYVGHGAYDPAIGTYMTPSNSTGVILSATRMVQELQAKSPRFSAVIFDCCNRERGQIHPSVRAPYFTLPTKVSPLFNDLFFRARGAVLLVSSSPGEYAFVRVKPPEEPFEQDPPPGPLFLNAFAGTLWRNEAQRMNWSQIGAMTQTKLDYYLRLIKDVRGLITLPDGRLIEQERQTIQMRFYR